MHALVLSAIVAILAAPRPSGRIVVLEDHAARASSDGGASFRPSYRVAATEYVLDGALAPDGTLFALRRDSLDVVRATSTTTRPALDARRVAVSGNTVAVLRNGEVDVSTDGGATFVTRSLPDPCAGCASDFRGMIDFTVAGGTPFVVETEINTCGSSDFLEWQRLMQIGPGVFQRPLVVPAADQAADWRFGAFGWMYGLTYAGRVLALSSAGAQPVIGLATGRAPHRFLAAHNERVTIAMFDSSLVEIHGASAQILDAHAKPADFLAVDGDDRPLVSDGKELWRFSRVTGWSKLALS